MDEEYGGGLTDILRVNGEAMNPENGESSDMNIINDCWQFESSNPLIIDDFGDPFSDFHQDPLLHDDHIQTDQDSRLIFNDNNLSVGDHQDLLIRRPANNLFGRMLQISPNTKLLVSESPREAVAVAGGAFKSPMLVVNDMINSRPKVEINAGIKRRKSQVKKVVCVPATAPSSSSNRPMSEVVPSDLWAWRKYGQKPIKGSPYPRSYYRCSSSKGCPARKQVERSRTDLNTLVITYTCEHNHPWPTQRNALASSTRTIQSSKNSSNSKSNSLITQSQKAGAHSSHDVNQPSVTTTGNSSIRHFCVKIKEMEEDHNKPTEIEHEEFFDVFPQSYRPVLAQAADKSEDFFADLGELEADPMNLLFSHGYSEVEAEENKSLDPFTFYEWAGSSREDKKSS